MNLLAEIIYHFFVAMAMLLAYYLIIVEPGVIRRMERWWWTRPGRDVRMWVVGNRLVKITRGRESDYVDGKTLWEVKDKL